MKPSVTPSVLKQSIVLFVKQADLLVVLLLVHLKSVVVDEVVAGVIGRVDVDHLHLAQIGLLEQLEHLQVVALDIQVFGGVPVLALLRTGAQGLADGLVGLHDGGLLAHPGELVGLVPLQHIVGQHLPEQLEVDGLFQSALAVRALRDTPGEQDGDLLYILRRQIRRLKFHVVHIFLLFHHCKKITMRFSVAAIHSYKIDVLIIIQINQMGLKQIYN